MKRRNREKQPEKKTETKRVRQSGMGERVGVAVGVWWGGCFSLTQHCRVDSQLPSTLKGGNNICVGCKVCRMPFADRREKRTA